MVSRSTLISPEVEQQVIQQWETIGISNDFVFCKIMQDEKLLSELIQRILPELKFKKLQLRSQKTVEIGVDIHGVRFDIFAAMEDGSIVEIGLFFTIELIFLFPFLILLPM